MNADREEPAARPLWLTTLADLALILVGFFVFLQAARPLDPGALASGFRAGFGIEREEPRPAPMPLPLALARLDGFAPGSAALPGAGALLDWARDAARDPRTHIRIQGESDGGREDVDPATGSGAILAVDRARAVAALIARAHVVPPERMEIATGTGPRRAVTLTVGFAGGRQDLAGRQLPPAGPAGTGRAEPATQSGR